MTTSVSSRANGAKSLTLNVSSAVAFARIAHAAMTRIVDTTAGDALARRIVQQMTISRRLERDGFGTGDEIRRDKRKGILGRQPVGRGQTRQHGIGFDQG